MFKPLRAALVAVMILSGLAAATSLQQPSASAAQTKPNIVVIMVDDARIDDLAAMDATRAIIGNDNGFGARYDKSYAPTSLCCPNRTSFLTGMYAHNHGVIDNSRPDGGWDAIRPLEPESLAVQLKQVGYNTVGMGKYLNQYADPSNQDQPTTVVPQGWSHWAMLSGGFANYKNFDITVGQSTVSSTGVGTIQHVTDGYQTTSFEGRAVNQLDQRLPGDNPVFMWLSFTAPHSTKLNQNNSICVVPTVPPYTGTSNIGVPESLAFDEPNVSDKPPWIQNNPQLTQTQKDDIVDCRRDRRESLKSVDDAVQAVRNALVANGEMSNTLLVFMSDNGYMLGEHRLPREKEWSYEESAAVPLLVRGPDGYGFPTGLQSRTVGTPDVTRTIADVAGADFPWPLDGKSLLAPDLPAGSYFPVLLEKLALDAEKPAYRGLRTQKYKYVEYAPGPVELYDLVADPWERDNVHGDPAYAAVEASLAAKLDEIRNCAGPACQSPWVSPN